MAYGFDLSNISLERFKRVIQEGYLIPSMRMLRDGIDDNFRLLEVQGINRISELENLISNQKKTVIFSEATGIDFTYMTLLRRLASSYRVKPRKLHEFPDIDVQVLRSMNEDGLKTSKALFEYIEREDSADVQKSLNLSEAELQLIVALMEVTQLRYVSPLFATAMVRSGYDSIVKITGAQGSLFLDDMKRINKE